MQTKLIKLYNVITILAIFSILAPNLSLAANNTVEAPKSIEEAQGVGEEVINKGKEIIPGTLQNLWEENVLPVWKKMYDWFKINIWARIEPRAKEEIEKRAPYLEEEFEKEKEELKNEIRTITNSLWSKGWEIIKGFIK